MVYEIGFTTLEMCESLISWLDIMVLWLKLLSTIFNVVHKSFARGLRPTVQKNLLPPLHVVIPYLTLIGANLETHQNLVFMATLNPWNHPFLWRFPGDEAFRLTQHARFWSTMWVKSLNFDRWMMLDDLGMDQCLLIPFLVGWTYINPSYFDVNYRGTRVLTHPHLSSR